MVIGIDNEIIPLMIVAYDFLSKHEYAYDFDTLTPNH